MIWTAILERDGQSSAISFNAEPDADRALDEIGPVVGCDGFEIVALMKGNQCHTFYGIDRKSQKLTNLLNSD